MFSVPVSFTFGFKPVPDELRPLILHEFAANGAKYLMLTGTDISRIMENRDCAARFRQELADEGLSYCDAHAAFGPMLDLACPVAEARPEMLMRHKLTLLITASMGVKTITIHTGNEPRHPDYPLEVQFDCLKRSLDELLPFAESLGITICIENIWYQLNTPERLLAVKKEFPTDALGFCYDAGHANLMDKGRNFPDSKPAIGWGAKTPAWDDRILEKMLPHVVNCHLHDNNGRLDDHIVPGLGTVNWKKIIPLLKKAPRLQVVTCEVIPIRTMSSIRDICVSLEKLGEIE